MCLLETNRTHAAYAADAKHISSNCTEITFLNEGTDDCEISISDSPGFLKKLSPGEMISFGTERPNVIEKATFNIKFAGALDQEKLIIVMRTYMRAVK